MRLYPIDDPAHSEVVDLLPWYANGTLDDDERARVERHLADCIGCKQELLDLRKMQTMYNDDKFDAAANAGLARVVARIEQLEARPRLRDRIRAAMTRFSGSRSWMQAALAAQLIIIVALSVMMLNRSEPHYYHTLSAPGPASPQRAALLVIFEPGRSEAQIRELLLGMHARIIDGPTLEGVYTLEVAPGERQRALAQLRAYSWIRFAEPVGQDTP